MGIRADQYVGITGRAKAFLEGIGAISAPNPEGQRWGGTFGGREEAEQLNRWVIPSAELERIDRVIEELQQTRAQVLSKLPTVCEEFVQDNPWSSGPMWFIGIKSPNPTLQSGLEDVNWTDEEVRTLSG